MAAIRLLAAPVDPPPISEVIAEYTSLVPANSLALATRTGERNDTSDPHDDFFWSASAGSDGSSTFLALPQKNSGNEWDSSPWNSFPLAQASGSDWYTQNAIFQYALHASMPATVNGQLINLYA
jgi:hypothetical protein